MPKPTSRRPSNQSYASGKTGAELRGPTEAVGLDGDGEWVAAALRSDAWGSGATFVAQPSCSRIGNGVIVGADAVVAGQVPSYTLVGGNPARPLRHRFPGRRRRTIRYRLVGLSSEMILAHEDLIMGRDIAALTAISPE
ncbi:MAG: hypothetical protein AAF755_14805 [Pseudomonadota bacterium]